MYERSNQTVANNQIKCRTAEFYHIITSFDRKYLCRLQCIPCPVPCFDSSEALNCSNRRRPASKRKNCGPVFWERAMCSNALVAKTVKRIRMSDGTGAGSGQYRTYDRQEADDTIH